VPQINEEGYINMIIHPSVSSSSSNVAATSFAGDLNTTISYPIIDVRETQTQILLKNGETIVIGGMLKDIKSKETIGIPFLSKLPYLGGLFRRDTYDTQKVDLLMFITARIIKEGEFTQEEISRLEQGLEDTYVGKEKKKKKRR
jgi:type II secretory pathway component GspD/PulD (secretin)